MTHNKISTIYEILEEMLMLEHVILTLGKLSIWAIANLDLLNLHTALNLHIIVIKGIRKEHHLTIETIATDPHNLVKLHTTEATITDLHRQEGHRTIEMTTTDPFKRENLHIQKEEHTIETMIMVMLSHKRFQEKEILKNYQMTVKSVLYPAIKMNSMIFKKSQVNNIHISFNY
ncbi:hypothetical protein LCX93_07805 [Sulfurimonas sp. SWIR-19]|uniref:hypothetical protein n=1 Tax=Sulfurimonas sp. SWIR-19 TaxID=2878390 RepID=UPI001CF36735|nr:hypothetical protein [Sulfurimonas sp. SWIR-19]UCM99440.1 hypothetical protein LCX93_07805 [Sulfurimonas sp. SWIR-19]